MSNSRPNLFDEINQDNNKDLQPGFVRPFSFANPQSLDQQAQNLIDRRNPDQAFVGSAADGRHDLEPTSPFDSDKQQDISSPSQFAPSRTGRPGF